MKRFCASRWLVELSGGGDRISPGTGRELNGHRHRDDRSAPSEPKTTGETLDAINLSLFWYVITVLNLDFNDNCMSYFMT